MHGVIDQIEDNNLEKLGSMLSSMLPMELMGGSINPIEDLLPALMGHGTPSHMIVMGRPESDTKVINFPGGRMIIKKMRSGHSEFMGDGHPMGLRRVLENKGECALGDKFPMSNPLEAMLSLLYAHGQKDKLPQRAIEEMIEPRAAEVAGSKLVEDIRGFVEGVEKGTREFMDTEQGKKVTVTIEDYVQATEDLNSEDNAVKEAAWITLDNPMHTKDIEKHMKKNRMTQTSLAKLAGMLDVYSGFGDEITGFINSLKYSMYHDGYLTTNKKTSQQQIMEKLSEVLKDKGVEDNEAIEDLVYNTDIPSEEGEIIQVGGYPIDVEKLNNMSYDEAKKALTGSIADIIFDDKKENVDIDKFKDFIEGLLNNQKSESEKEEVQDRIIDPILSTFQKESGLVEAMLEAFAPSQDLLDRAGIE